MPLTCIAIPSWTQTYRRSGHSAQAPRSPSGLTIECWHSWEESQHDSSLLPVVTREYGSMDGVDVDVHINANVLGVRRTVTHWVHAHTQPDCSCVSQREVTQAWRIDASEAWRIDASEAVVIRLHLCSSQYLSGPGEPQPYIHITGSGCAGNAGLVYTVFCVYLSYCNSESSPTVDQ